MKCLHLLQNYVIKEYFKNGNLKYIRVKHLKTLKMFSYLNENCNSMFNMIQTKYVLGQNMIDGGRYDRRYFNFSFACCFLT